MIVIVKQDGDLTASDELTPIKAIRVGLGVELPSAQITAAQAMAMVCDGHEAIFFDTETGKACALNSNSTMRIQ